MKITYRVPTRQYAYIEIEDEVSPQEGIESGIMKTYFRLEDEYKKQQAERDAVPLKKAKAKEFIDDSSDNGVLDNEPPFEEDVECGIGKTRNEYLKSNKK